MSHSPPSQIKRLASCIKTRRHIRIHKLMLATHIGFSIVVKLLCAVIKITRIWGKEKVLKSSWFM